MNPDSIAWCPIGVIHSPFPEPAGTPIQGVFAPEAEGVVEVFEEFAGGLRDVEMFSHLYLLYAFHRSGPPVLSCVPFLDTQPHGVFATRAPRRPNAIGLSVVRLLSREGGVLRVAGVDMVDGTPLLDIKPYVPRFDCWPEASAGWMKADPPRSGTAVADGRFGV